MNFLQDRLDKWILRGVCYEASAVISLAAGNDTPALVMGEAGTHYAVIKAPPDRALILFSREISFDGDGVYAYVYRDPTFTPSGTTLTWANDGINNPNDIKSRPSTATIEVNVTPTDLGELSRSAKFIFGNQSNQGKGGILQTIEIPQIIAPNEELLLVFKNIGGNTERVGSHLVWVEVEYIEGLFRSLVEYQD